MWYRVGLLMALAGVCTVPAGLLAVLFAGPVVGAVVFVVGWFFLVPIIPILAAFHRLRSAGEKTGDSPVDDLKDRYVRGEIDEAEFFDRLEHLSEAEAREPPDSDAPAGEPPTLEQIRRRNAREDSKN